LPIKFLALFFFFFFFFFFFLKNDQLFSSKYKPIKKKSFRFTFHIAGIGIESHQFDRFVVAPRGDQITCRAPGKTVNRSFMMFGTLEENGGLARSVVIPVTKDPPKKKEKMK
jgi:hypothetical protein